ncbi:MAG TPA: ROK family protein [Spirochaetia bacterium]|nr:ROK family protein [Spirochaetia bacterium]
MGEPSIESLDFSHLQVLYSIFSAFEPTRSTIAAATKYSLVKATNLVNSLEKMGIVHTAGKTTTNGGRPSYIYQMNGDVGYSVGISIGNDHLQVALSNGTGNTFHQQRFPLVLPSHPARHAAAIMDRVCAVYESVRREGRGPALSLGLALPGTVDSKRGLWLQGLQLSGIFHLNIAETLSRRLGIPTYLEDVARTLAWLAMAREPTSLLDHFVLMYLGLGMGTGVVINGNIYSGLHGMAGEIGHIEHANNEYRCSCNNVGCFETLLSVPGVLRLFRDRLAEGVQSVLQRPGVALGLKQLSLKEILNAARNDDRFAIMTLEEVGTFLGDACAMIVKLFNPACVMITGPLAIFKDYFLEPVKRVVAQKVLPEMLEGYETLFVDQDATDEAAGAALLALDRYLIDRIAMSNGGKSK